MQVRTRSSAPGSTCCAGSKSTKAGRFSTAGEFFRQIDVIGLSGIGGEGGPAGRESDLPIKYESVAAVSRFERSQLVEVRLHPVELTDQGVRLAHRGIPRLASAEAARRILTRLQAMSAPLGTTITIEGSVGIIRPREIPATVPGFCTSQRLLRSQLCTTM